MNQQAVADTLKAVILRGSPVGRRAGLAAVMALEKARWIPEEFERQLDGRAVADIQKRSDAVSLIYAYLKVVEPDGQTV